MPTPKPHMTHTSEGHGTMLAEFWPVFQVPANWLKNIEKTALYSDRQSWKMSETDKVVSIIKDVQCWRLGKWDGCCCSHFSIREVEVDIACGKGKEQSVTVRSGSSDFPDENSLRPIMDEVIRQVTEQSGRSGEFKQIIVVDGGGNPH